MLKGCACNAGGGSKQRADRQRMGGQKDQKDSWWGAQTDSGWGADRQRAGGADRQQRVLSVSHLSIDKLPASPWLLTHAP